jgi:exopolyphosphatase/guanosine-5'-triphosphate,3'-diphosphate pyrophosphatase
MYLRAALFMHKLAIIDLGTNTFHLLIAEGNQSGYRITYRERLAVKIGMGGINRSIITPEGLQRALVAMHSFKNKIELAGVDKVFAFGTSALRNASNGNEVVDKIEALTGIRVNIISGEEEAAFIHRGVMSALDVGLETSLIIDIGGGSVEFIICNNQQVFWKRSFEIGAQRLVERFQKHDPILPEEIQQLDAYFKDELPELFAALQQYQPTLLVGSSGTFDTLSDIFCHEHDIHKSDDDPETPLSIAGIREIYADLIKKNRSERLQIPGMIEMRVDMIVVATCLIRFLVDTHPFEHVRVSTYALKEGVLSELSKQSVK